LYGIAVNERRLSLDATLADLRIDDLQGLTTEERRARVRDLVAARSGVYHPAAYAAADQDNERPTRGSHAPGTFWFYNNWDFNVAEAIYEQVTSQNLYAAFNDRIAGPIGMEDFSPTEQFLALEPSLSRFAAHTLRISARDLARFGLLYLQEGQWDGRQIVPRDWVKESLSVHSRTGEHQGYGYLWWIYEPGALGDAYPILNRSTVYLSRGTGGQALFLVPSHQMVVVHRTDTDNGRSVPGPAIWQLVERLVAARTGQPIATPALEPVRPVPFTSSLPAPPPLTVHAVDQPMLQRLVGDYAMAKGGAVRVFLHEGRLFMNVPGQGEAELFAIGSSTFTVKVAAGVRVTFQTEGSGPATAVTIALGRQLLEATRR
jgi:CubicO group peptidase (beta-lactamase class C family)